jgi:hypothetical protein
MPDGSLLSASIQYGLVARSFPFTDTVLEGYLNATGVPPGLSYDNPGTEPAPNLSVCILASTGPTAKVIWGRRDGSLSVLSHPHTMSGNGVVHINTSLVDQEHDDAVLDGTWASNGDALVTAGADGRVKVWTSEPFCCVWTSERHLQGPETDAIVRVIEDLNYGFVVAASRSGDIIVLSGFDMSLDPADKPQPTIQKFSIPGHELSKADVGLTQTPQSADILSLISQVTSPTRLSVLVCRVDSAHFYRCTVDPLSKQVTTKAFGNPAFGFIRCIHPAFSNEPAEPEFVIAGTQLGFISIYDWNGTSLSSDALLESRHTDVFDNSHVTCLAVNSFVIAAGSARGTITVLDLLTLETLRSIAAPMNGDVGQIELIGEALVASVGGKVLAWSSGRLTPASKDALKTKGKGKQQSHGKWFKQLEIRNEIADAKTRFAEESRSIRRPIGPEHEQSKKLRSLGLSEREAVEYALMLSRDEELQRVQRSSEHVDEQEADENSGRQSGSEPSFPGSSSSSERYSPPLLSRRSTSGTGSSSRELLASLAPPTSNVKVQVSPHFHPEPKKAGGLPDSPKDEQSPRSVLSSQSKPGPTPSRATFSMVASTTSSPTKQNAWRKPLPGAGSSTSPSGPSTLVTQSKPGSHWEAEAERISRVEDLELRFALELSLAEAQSRESAKK